MMSDSIERMNKITDVMSNITSMPPSKRDAMVKQAREIAVYNKQHFFSDVFHNQVINELKTNLKTAYTQLTPKS
jgi:metal-sulfur cluster biosynthetic enzyme